MNFLKLLILNNIFTKRRHEINCGYDMTEPMDPDPLYRCSDTYIYKCDHSPVYESIPLKTDTTVQGSSIHNNTYYHANRYFAIIERTKLNDMYNVPDTSIEFQGGINFINQLRRINYNPEKHYIIEAALIDDATYFIESNQSIAPMLTQSKYKNIAFTIVTDPTSAFASIPNFKPIQNS